MVKRLRQIPPDRLQIREGGGAIALFGMPFLAVGVFILLSLSGLVHVKPSPPSAWPPMVLLGVAFGGVGAALVFGRRWTTIDRAQRTIVRELGLIVPLLRETFRTDDYTAVSLGFSAGDSDTATTFPVTLKARAGKDLRLCDFTSYADSRACAAAIGQHLGFSLVDASTDHPVTMSPDQADRPFAGRPIGTDRTSVERPATARSDVRYDADAVRIAIPAAPLHPVVIGVRAMPILIGVAIAPRFGAFAARDPNGDPVAWLPVAIIGSFFVIIPALALAASLLRSWRGATLVAASRQGLQIRERGAIATRTVASIDAADILDVDYGTRDTMVAMATQTSGQAISPMTLSIIGSLARFVKGRGLIVKTRQGLTTFGQALDDDEIRYLHGVIRNALHA